MFKPQLFWVALIAATAAGCDKPTPQTPEPRPVRTVTVGRQAEGNLVSLTGQVRPKDQASLAFRLDGRVTERLVNVGDSVTAGQILGRLDARNQENILDSQGWPSL